MLLEGRMRAWSKAARRRVTLHGRSALKPIVSVMHSRLPLKQRLSRGLKQVGQVWLRGNSVLVGGRGTATTNFTVLKRARHQHVVRRGPRFTR